MIMITIDNRKEKEISEFLSRFENDDREIFIPENVSGLDKHALLFIISELLSK